MVQGMSSACDPAAACVASATGTGSKRSITANLTANVDYYIAVDSKSAVSTPYNLRLTSTMCPSPNCDNTSKNTNLGCTYMQESRRNDDAGHSVNLIDNWGTTAARCATNTTGNEVVYQFSPIDDGSYTVDLTGIAAGQNLDLIVTEGVDAFTCDANTICVGAGTNTSNTSEKVTFTADSTKYYYIAVDGVAGSASKYNIALSSTACAGPVCQNGFNSIDCTVGGRAVSGSNDASSSTSAVTTWGATTSCATAETGPEFAHKFVPSKTGSYTIQLLGMTANLDLIVLAANSSGDCNAKANTCVGAGVSLSTSTESVTVTLSKGKTYYLIVDGKNGAISDYSMVITSGC